MLSDEQREQLSEPVPASEVSQREGAGGRALDYIDRHAAYSAASTIIGVGRWGYTMPHGPPRLVAEWKDDRDRFRVSYLATVRLSGPFEPIEEVGYGDGMDRSPGAAHELGAKEAVTDAVKRALSALAERLGGSLYAKGEARPAPQRAPQPSQGGQARATMRDGETVPFGKHKGKPWAEVPGDYLEWLRDKAERDEVRALALRELQRRAA